MGGEGLVEFDHVHVVEREIESDKGLWVAGGKQCMLPLTGLRYVHRIITDMAVMDVGPRI
nr:hypothetical protein [Nocardia abscessus]